jgi:hypothetical protein
MGGLLGKDAILAADDIQTQRVEVPEWGGDVMVRGLTGQQRDAWEAGLSVRRGKQLVPDMRNFRARLVVMCVVDETGAEVFGLGDVDALSGKSGAALDRIYDVAARLSGISENDVEDLTGNFGTTDGGSSSSTSP